MLRQKSQMEHLLSHVPKNDGMTKASKYWLLGHGWKDNTKSEEYDLVKYLNDVERSMLPWSKDSDQWSYLVSAGNTRDEAKLWRKPYKLIFIQHPFPFNNKDRTAERRLLYDDIMRTDEDSDVLMHWANRQDVTNSSIYNSIGYISKSCNRPWCIVQGDFNGVDIITWWCKKSQQIMMNENRIDVIESIRCYNGRKIKY